MRTTILAAILGSAAGVIAAGPAAAHEYLYHPYVIEKRCDEYGQNCRVRLDYAPGEHLGLAGAGSYWYQNPGQRHYHMVYEEPARKRSNHLGQGGDGCPNHGTGC